MLDQSQNTNLYLEWLQHIESPAARDAFRYMVGYAATLRDFTCHAKYKSENKRIIRDFRFIDSRGEQPFSFITNQKWLLFYFRPPAIASNRYNRELLMAAFPDFNCNTVGEWTLKIDDVDKACRLKNFLNLE